MQLGHPNDHMELTRAMARAMGFRLSEQMSAGQLAPQDFAAMVTRCRACAHATACRHWLDTQTQTAQHAPDHCANARVLNTLAAQ